MNAVLRALMRAQTRALVFEHVAELVATMFRGTDARPPTKLLAMPNGTRCRAELEDVVEIEEELQRLAYASRVAMNTLKQASVIVDATVLQRDGVPPGPLASPLIPEGEGVEDAPAAMSAGTRSIAEKK